MTLDKIIQKYMEMFEYKAELIPFDFTDFEPVIESEEDLYNAYENCIKQGKKWEELYKIVGTEGVRE